MSGRVFPGMFSPRVDRLDAKSVIEGDVAMRISKDFYWAALRSNFPSSYDGGPALSSTLLIFYLQPENSGYRRPVA